MNAEQTHRAEMILGFVNNTLKQMAVLHNIQERGVHEEEAMYVIQAAMFREHDKEVIEHCEAKFKEWYNY